ncbi:MAG: hypothetical protein ACK559_40125 [bacterium]
MVDEEKNEKRATKVKKKRGLGNTCSSGVEERVISGHGVDLPQSYIRILALLGLSSSNTLWYFSRVLSEMLK